MGGVIMVIEQQGQELSCKTEIDYSSVQTGGKKLPFVIKLDLVNSVLYPQPNENQKFCYSVTGVGEDRPEFADLSHFLFSICSEIVASDFVSITVFIDGVRKTVQFKEGGNVEIKTAQKPDHQTGCTGLKFDFPVSKVQGSRGSLLSLCFEMNKVYSIGEVPVCLYGGNAATHELSICGPVCSSPPIDCQVIAFQHADICVPIIVTPYAEAGEITTVCCGSPSITQYASECLGAVAQCTFTITQDVCITVPISFGANVNVGEAKVQCAVPDLIGFGDSD